MSGNQVVLPLVSRIIPCEYIDEPYISESIFNWIHFCRRLYMPISMVLGVMSYRSWQKSLKIAKKTRYVGSRSFKVVEFVTNRKGICDLLLVVNNNAGHVSYGFKATAIYWSKSLLGNISLSHLTPSL